MLTYEQYKIYYDFVMNSISKMRQTYKYFNDFLSLETIHYLTHLLSTWEFDDKWVKNKMSEKIRESEDKNIIREEFYNNLISKIDFEEEELTNDNICGFYSLSTTISYKISNDKTIQKIENRKIVIDNDKLNQRIILTFFLVYHMLIVEGLIEDKGICISINQLISDFCDDLDIVNLCKICTKDILIKDNDLIDDIGDFSEKQGIPVWFIENYLKYKNT